MGEAKAMDPVLDQAMRLVLTRGPLAAPCASIPVDVLEELRVRGYVEDRPMPGGGVYGRRLVWATDVACFVFGALDANAAAALYLEQAERARTMLASPRRWVHDELTGEVRRRAFGERWMPWVMAAAILVSLACAVAATVGR